MKQTGRTLIILIASLALIALWGDPAFAEATAPADKSMTAWQFIKSLYELAVGADVFAG